MATDNKKAADRNRALPASLEAEQSILGCIMMDAGIALDLMSELKIDDFYVNSHKLIFEAMLNVTKGNRPIDLVTLMDELDNMHSLSEAGGVQYVTEVMKSVPSTANYRHYLKIVKRDSMMRKLIYAAQGIVDETYQCDNENTALAYAEKCIFDISNAADTSSLVNLKDAFSDVVVKFSAIQNDKNAFRGLMTGFTDVDRLTNGLQKSDLILVAARPGVGKTSFSCNIIENVSVYRGGVCAVYSLEMPRVQLAQRMICSVAGVSMSKAIHGELTAKDWENIWKASEIVNKSKIFVDDSSLSTPREMLSKCRRLKTRYGLDLVMIDYVQLMSGDARRYDNRQQEISDISRNLKIMAKELNVPVIALSQLSRAAEQADRPQLSHLRESGAIEQDADIVMFIHRPDMVAANADKVQRGEIQKDTAEIIVAKHRNGALDNINLKWIGEMTKFVNIDKRGEDTERTYGLSPEPEYDTEPSAVPQKTPPLDKTASDAYIPAQDTEFRPITDGAAPPFEPDVDFAPDANDALF